MFIKNKSVHSSHNEMKCRINLAVRKSLQPQKQKAWKQKLFSGSGGERITRNLIHSMFLINSALTIYNSAIDNRALWNNYERHYCCFQNASATG